VNSIGGSKGEVAARYRESLPDKLNELALSWEAWLAAPEGNAARDQLHLLVHRLAGAAPAYGYNDLGREAQRIDGMLQSWMSEVPQLRVSLPELCRQLAAPMEALLRTLGRAAREVTANMPEGEGAPPRERVLFVLFLEDDKEQAHIWRDALTREGLRVRIADSLPAFEAEIILETPDVLLIDFWLDGHTAGDVARELSGMPEFCDIPKVCLTADDGMLPRQVAMDAGFTAVLRKTVTPADLARVLRQSVATRPAPR
jgi:CheY-like chemotaxis protein